MWNKLKKQLLKTSKVIGIEIVDNNHQHWYNLVILERKKDNISIVEKRQRIQEFETLVGLFDGNTPIYLVLNVKGILHKTTTSEGTTSAQLLQAILPNTNPINFYIQAKKLLNNTAVSLVRKGIIEDYLTKFKEQNLWVLGLHLGAFHVDLLHPLVNHPEFIQTELYQLQFTNGQIIDFKTKIDSGEDSVLIGKEWLQTALTTAFAAAFQPLVGAPIPTLESEQIQNNQEEFFHKRLFVTGGWTILITFLVVLLINTLLFFQYQDKNQILNTQLSLKQGQLNELDTLKQRLAQKESLQNNIAPSQTSYYADQIALHLPNNIQLTYLEIFPPEKGKPKDVEEIQLFQSNLLKIKGKCKNSLTYNEWLRTMRKQKWIEEVQNISFQDIEPNVSEFELKITINSDSYQEAE